MAQPRLLAFPPAWALAWPVSLFTPSGAFLTDAAGIEGTPPCEVAFALERTIRAGQSHSCTWRAEPGDLLELSAVQAGVNVVLKIQGPDGRRVEADLSDGPLGRERASLVAETAGAFRLEVAAEDVATPEGPYVLTLEAPRPATAADADRVAAERLLLEARALAKEQTAEKRRAALDLAGQARALARALEDGLLEAHCRFEEGRLQLRLGALQEAGSPLREALWRAREMQEPGLEAHALTQLGILEYYLNELPDALDHFKQALDLRRSAGDRRGEAASLDDVASATGAMGQIHQALSLQRQALDLRRRLGDRNGVAQLLHHIAVSHQLLGEMQRAIDVLHEVLADGASGDRKTEAAARGTLAYLYGLLGEPGDALPHARRSLEIFRAMGFRVGEVGALEGLGGHLEALGETHAALECYEQALALHRALAAPDDDTFVLQLRMAAAYRKVGDHDKAAEHEAAGLRAPRNEQAWTTVRLLTALGEVYDEQGDVGKAVEHYERALSMSRSIRYRPGEAEALQRLAAVDLRQGALGAARDRLESALELMEDTRNEVGRYDLRASLVARTAGLHEQYLDVLVKLHEREPSAGLAARAFEASERGRVQSLLEQLSEAHRGVRDGVDAAVLERERSLREQLAFRLERQMRLLAGPHAEGDAEAAAAAVQETRNAYGQLQAEIRRSSPRYAELRQPEVLGLAEVQSRLLDDGTLLLEYALGEERSFLFAVGPASLRTFVLPGRAEVEEVARRAYDELARGGQADAELDRALRAASEMLLGPVAAELRGKRLVIAADGLLHYLPFGALPAPNRNGVPLVRDHEVVNVPSASLVSVLRAEAARRTPARKTAAVFADPVFDAGDERVGGGAAARSPSVAPAPPGSAEEAEGPRRLTRALADTGLDRGIPRLPFTRREAHAILSRVPRSHGKRALDFQANREAATSGELADYRIVHFATHGFLNNTHPELSGLVLSLVDRSGAAQDGFLSAEQVFNLELSADLVVLSGCRTALGKRLRGEGVLGLTRAFMYAGTSRVLASLWKVDDAATAALMARLYEGILTRGLTPAQALRQAQMSLAQEKRWRHPYYWAGFQLQGDWK